MTVLMKTRNISVRLSDTRTLSFPDLDIHAGASVLLSGASGSGKTTLLSVLSGLLPPTTGQLMYGADDFYALPAGARDVMRGTSFGFIFQTLHLLPYLTAAQNVELAMRIPGRSVDKARVLSVFEQLGIANKMTQKPHQLSHGERQRVAIARAVIHQPAILFADEPTSALDDANTKATIDLIKHQARAHNATLILATHDGRITGGFDKTISLGTTEIQKAAA